MPRSIRAGKPAAARRLRRREPDRRHRVLIVVERPVLDANPGLAERLRGWFAARPDAVELVTDPFVLPGGEAAKNDYRLTMTLIDAMLEHRMDRQSYVIGIGGGALLDAAGFAASLVHRGLRMVRVPTTVLAQNDAAVGVKTAMNLHGGKNTIGTFAPPFAVINDFLLLHAALPRLDRRRVRGVQGRDDQGRRVLRLALRRRPAPARPRRRRDGGAGERCALLHLDHIRAGGDPFEMGSARPLDFGHWSAHKLESLSGYRVRHGEAVATGIALDALYARRLGLLAPADAARLLDALRAAGFDLWYPEMDERLGDGTHALLQGLADFQEHLGGDLCITLPDGVGRRVEVHTMDFALLADALGELRAFALVG
ncbi:MAG: 3-dehydroquinate synthase [Kiritimatiellia bacterium]